MSLPNATTGTTRLTVVHKGIIVFALAPLAVRFVAQWVCPNFWGLNHLEFTSVTHVAITAIVSVIAMALMWHDRVGGVIIDALNKSIWGRGKLGVSAILLVGGLVFWFGSSHTHVFADGYARIGNLAQRTVPFVHPLEWGATVLSRTAYTIFRGVHDKTTYDAAMALRLISVISGVAWLAIIHCLASWIGQSLTQKTFIFCLALFSGSFILALGNVEVYGPLLVIVTAHVLLCVLAAQEQSPARRKRYLLGVILVGALAPFYLAQGVFLLPTTILTVFICLQGRSRECDILPRPWIFVLWGIIIALVCATILRSATDNLWIAARIVTFGPKPPEFGYRLISLPRFVDLFNDVMVLVPTALCALATIPLFRRQHFHNRTFVVIFSSTVCALCWIIISDSPNGAARDITTIAPYASTLAVFVGYLLLSAIGEGVGASRSIRVVVATAALSIAVYLPVYVQGEASVAYLDHDYQNRPGRYLSGLYDFRDHYFFRREFAKVDAWEWSFEARSPVFLEVTSMEALIVNKSPAEAVSRASLVIATNPYWSPLYFTQAQALQIVGNHREALRSIDLARQLAPENVSMVARRADIWREMGIEDSCYHDLMTALDMDPVSPEALRALGLYYVRAGRAEDAIREAYLLFEADSTDVYPFLIIGAAELKRENWDRAQRYLQYFVSEGANLPEVSTASQMLLQARQRAR